jgi:exopolyphosphatase/guanosine-5'-triphosphate,3'-diphosphate pyrophosphatase
LRAAVDEPLARLGWLAQGRGRDLYLVGGACRTLARIHMEHAGYPLHIIQHYVIGRGDAAAFLDLLFHLSRTSLERIAALPRKRLDAVPLAAFVLARLVRAIAPRRIVFSAFGLREGHLYDLCPAADRGQDPLLAASAATAAANRRFGIEASELERWTAPLFPEEDARRRRLRSAAALLGDVHWAEHPDYRAEQAFLKTLRMPVGGLDHGERVFLATVLHARYGGAGDAWILAATRRLLQEDDAATARALGIALRLAYTLTGGAPGLLRQTSVALDSGTVTVTAADNGIFSGDAVQRRLEALGKAFGRRAVLMAAAATRRGESACPPR